MRKYSDIPLWKDVPPKQWGDWHWQLRNAVTTADKLEQIIKLSDKERRGIDTATKYFRMRISPHIATLLDPDDPNDPLRKQFVPSSEELVSMDDDGLFTDVRASDRFSPIRGLIHRYPTKVLLLPSNYCGAYCRYCFRRKLARGAEEILRKDELQSAFKYIENDTRIEEVILSGGDPLVLGDETLDFILGSAFRIPHVQILRVHTRMPISVPYRITSDLVSILSQYKPLYVIIHVDTAREITNPMREAVSQLIDNGIPCFASCPLLKGVNDSEVTLRSLWTELIKMRVKPYRIFHSDPVKGLRHFIVPIERGLEIMRNLYDHMSGLAMPHYCLNVPNGGGHALLNYNYVEEIGAGRYLIRTFEGNQIEYVDQACCASRS